LFFITSCEVNQPNFTTNHGIDVFFEEGKSYPKKTIDLVIDTVISTFENRLPRKFGNGKINKKLKKSPTFSPSISKKKKRVNRVHVQLKKILKKGVPDSNAMYQRQDGATEFTNQIHIKFFLHIKNALESLLSLMNSFICFHISL
jgi:hypothetical protein